MSWLSGWVEKCPNDLKSVRMILKVRWSEKCTARCDAGLLVVAMFVVGSGLVWLLVLALYGCWLCPCGSWFWLWPYVVVGCNHSQMWCGVVATFVVGSGLVSLLVLAFYGCWLWPCGSWFWFWANLVVGCGHMLLLVVTTSRCVVASFGCWLWPRVLWATPAPNWQLSTGVLASWPWSPRCNLTKKSMKFFLGQGLVRILWEMCMGYVAEGSKTLYCINMCRRKAKEQELQWRLRSRNNQ